MTLHRTIRAALLALSFCAASASAISLADLSNQDASSGLKAALEKGSMAAVGKLGVPNGFLQNEQVKIHLPGPLEKARPFLKMAGKGEQLDEMVELMNHAAEQAVPMAKPLLVNAVKSMSVKDAKNILTGGDTSVTDFFREKTSAELAVKFLPLVKKVTDKSDLSAKYNSLMRHAGGRLGGDAPATVEDYVTARALAALYTMIGEEEKSIRSDPLGSGSKIIGKVFGALR
jgi:hypothetical protein